MNWEFTLTKFARSNTISFQNSIKLVNDEGATAPPPELDQQSFFADPQMLIRLLACGPNVNGKYLHWDKLIRYSPPEGLSHEQWWTALKLSRQSLYKPVPLFDTLGNSFQFTMVDPIGEITHEVDLKAGGSIQEQEQITNPEVRDRYYVNSLIEEAITSSQLEGATTTRQVAKEMIRAGRRPRDKSEQMIFNNFLTMQEIGKLRHEPLTSDMVLTLHRLVTDQTLDDVSAAGRFRKANEKIYVGDDFGSVFHDPPPAHTLAARAETMCRFANGLAPAFIHPVIRSIILHFWLAYDHPFVDGNGRTARALFYWSMLKHGYWLFEFISISRILRHAPARYGLAFLYTETDENDLTYFILYHLQVIQRAIRELHDYIQRKTSEMQETERNLRGMVFFNHRQRALIGHAIRHPGTIYTIESHRKSHNVVYETGRSDLLDMQHKGLLEGHKVGKTWHFRPVPDMAKRLTDMEF